ncbi:2530_t:CDS:2 [Diversispora eburnea]|uniref:2530_t:CDS:1 n=1 Tax=Diversispora eburnea TaxID=1213867 RepID=A0A9N9F093_9GLOM|nr:2530_t:CDS:2 [Diversispora eburnea]
MKYQGLEFKGVVKVEFGEELVFETVARVGVDLEMYLLIFSL